MQTPAGATLLTFSRAGYQAMDPFGDTTLLEVRQGCFVIWGSNIPLQQFTL